MSTPQCWLWPDRVIGKCESRVLREEHNALVKCHDELLGALKLARDEFERLNGAGTSPGEVESAIALGIDWRATHSRQSNVQEELLEALRDLLVICISRGTSLGLDDGGPVLDKARAAIQKAGTQS